MRKTIVLKRKCGQKTNEATIKGQVEDILNRGLTGPRGKGWSYSLSQLSEPQKEGEFWAFTYKITLNKTTDGRSERPANEKQWPAILENVIKAGKRSIYGPYPWIVIAPSKNELEQIFGDRMDEIDGEEESTSVESMLKKYADISLDRGDHYQHIYDRDAQIEIVNAAISAAQDSGMANRYHCVLWGPPGCGKTEIMKATCEMLGIEDEAYMMLDATSTSKAGIEKHLLDPDTPIPVVLAIEEIEKTSDKDLRWLLGVLDQRAEIRKLNYRVNSRRSVPMLCIATVNDMDLFKSVMSGALASRFPNKLYCPRPDRAIMEKILEREVKKHNGKREWIEPTLTFAFDKLELTDPRAVIPICLCGRDSLISGDYQKWVVKTMEPEVTKRLQKSHPELFA